VKDIPAWEEEKKTFTAEGAEKKSEKGFTRMDRMNRI